MNPETIYIFACPACKGQKGFTNREPQGDGTMAFTFDPCPQCRGTGELPLVLLRVEEVER